MSAGFTGKGGPICGPTPSTSPISENLLPEFLLILLQANWPPCHSSSNTDTLLPQDLCICLDTLTIYPNIQMRGLLPRFPHISSRSPSFITLRTFLQNSLFSFSFLFFLHSTNRTQTQPVFYLWLVY